MMETNTQAWDDLLGEALTGRYKLHTLTFKGREQADFLAEPLDHPTGAPVTITLIPSEDGGDDLLADIERASRLKHPNLLEILETGVASIRGSEYVYLAAETPEYSLARRLSEGRLSLPETGEMLSGVVAGLQFLHSRGLACCAVEPETVVRAGEKWKLADLSRVQPLEVVTPGQDIAALGALTRDVFGGRTPPAPFDSIVEGCLGVNGAPRLSLDEVRALLDRTAEPAPASTRRMQRLGPLWAAGALGIALAGAWTWTHSRNRVPEPPPATPPVVQKPAPAPVHAPAEKPSPYQRFTPGSQPRAAVSAPARTAAQSKNSRAEIGRADFFNSGADGHMTASGVRVNSRDLVASHAHYPFGTRLKVTNLRNGKSVVVRVVDRRSAAGGRILSVSEAAARELGFLGAGWANVKVERVD